MAKIIQGPYNNEGRKLKPLLGIGANLDWIQKLFQLMEMEKLTRKLKDQNSNDFLKEWKKLKSLFGEKLECQRTSMEFGKLLITTNPFKDRNKT